MPSSCSSVGKHSLVSPTSFATAAHRQTIRKRRHRSMTLNQQGRWTLCQGRFDPDSSPFRCFGVRSHNSRRTKQLQVKATLSSLPCPRNPLWDFDFATGHKCSLRLIMCSPVPAGPCPALVHTRWNFSHQNGLSLIADSKQNASFTSNVSRSSRWSDFAPFQAALGRESGSLVAMVRERRHQLRFAGCVKRAGRHD